ncbi:MAG: urea ABC transporter substrate-binding protein [Candidatus Omnitrophota bacterium]
MNVVRKIFLGCLAGLLVVLLFFYSGQILDWVERTGRRSAPPLKVGILHSLTGTMALSEKPVMEATLLALEELNAGGGIHGRKIEPVVADGKSDPDIFRQEAERLIIQEKVEVLFGCWTSASRKAVRPIVEKYNSLLFYPVQYEGAEISPNIVYLGAAPNQQLIPAIHWALKHLGKRFFLVGSDYVYPRVAHDIAKQVIRFSGGEVVGEAYRPLGAKDFLEIAKQIQKTRPDVILNTINGDSNILFFEALDEIEISSQKAAIFSFSMDENLLKAVREYFAEKHPEQKEHFFKEHIKGLYACWNYFQAIDTPLNADFIAKLKQKRGGDILVTDPMEAAYYGVHLWGRAAREGDGEGTTQDLLNRLRHLSILAPEGPLAIADNHHARKTVRIGRANEAGVFEILWTSDRPVAAAPYPSFRPKAYWEKLLETLSQKWGGRWEASSGAGLNGEKR